jgi:hypothetical protein
MRFFIIAAILLLCAATTQAQVYKWTDPQGRVHYSAKPPPDARASEVRIAPGPSSPDPDTRSAEPAKAAEKAAEAGEPASGDAARQAALQRNCELARQNLGILEDPSIRRFREDGQEEAIYYTDEERQARIEQTQAMIERFCLQDGAD